MALELLRSDEHVPTSFTLKLCVTLVLLQVLSEAVAIAEALPAVVAVVGVDARVGFEVGTEAGDTEELTAQGAHLLMWRGKLE